MRVGAEVATVGRAAWGPRGPGRPGPAALVVLVLLAGRTAAQPPTIEARWEVHIAATEQIIWLGLVDQSRSLVFYRQVGGRFDPGRMTERRIVGLAALEQALLVFFEHDAPYRYFPDAGPPRIETILPAGATPLDVVGQRGRIYALVPAAVARRLPATAPAADGQPATQPGPASPAADESPLWLVAYDGQRWRALAPLPAEVRPQPDRRLRPRLCFDRGRLWLLALEPAAAEPPGLRRRLMSFAYNQEDRTWAACEPLVVGPVSGFWVTSYSRVPTLVTATPPDGRSEREGGLTANEQIRVRRLLGDALRAGASAWQPAELEFSDLPAAAEPVRYLNAVGFNQHLALLALGADRQAYVQFARDGGPPVEQTLAVAELLAGPDISVHVRGLFQLVTTLVLAAALVVLFVFRRGSLVRQLPLPVGCAPAFNFQRLLGWLIDFLPFAWIGSWHYDVPVVDGLRSLTSWALIPSQTPQWPERNVLAWWSFAVTCHTGYALILELILRRTPGKYFTRVFLLSESGAPPGAGQIVGRNLTRLIELTPQLWVFLVLVVFSRNRQRLGDIFARTVAVRTLPRGAPPDSGPTEPPGPEHSGQDEERSGSRPGDDGS